MGDAVMEKEKASLPSTHISSSISINDSFGTIAKSLEKSWYFSLFTKNSNERKNVMALGKEAEKKYNDPDNKNNREYLKENIYEKAISNSDKYLSDHTAPKTMAGKKIWRQMLEARNAAKQEKAIVENSVIHENEGLTIKNVLFNSTQSYTVDDFKRFKKKQNAYEGYEGNHGDNIHRNAYLMLAKKDFESLSKSEKVAMNAYTTNSGDINDALRKGEYESGKCDETLLNNITHMKHAFAKHNLPSDITTYRGVNDGMIKYWLGLKGVDKDQAGEFLNANGSINHDKFYQLKIYEKLNGITFQDKAFVSTTTNKPFAKRWTNELVYHKFDDYNDEVGSHIMVMNIPKGTRAMFSDTMFTKTGNEKEKNELTLDAGYTYTINNVKPIGPGMYELNTTVNGDIEKIEIDRNQSVIAQRSSESFIGNYSDLYSLLTTLKIRLIAIFPDNRANNIINSINHINFILNGFNPDWITIKRELNNIYEKSIDISEKNVTQLQFNLLRQCIKLSDENETLLRRINYYILKKSILKNGNKVNYAFSPRKMYKTAKNLEQKKYNESYSNVVNSVLSNSEMNIVKDYTSDNYIYYNKVERENDPLKAIFRSNNNQMDDATRISYKKKSDILSKSIDKFTTKKEEIYYRGLSDFNCLKFMLLADVAKKWPNSPNIHNVYNLLTQNIGCNLLEKGYMSVSNNKEISMKFGGNKTTGALLKIIIPPGISALPIMKFSEYNTEEELILNRGTIFEVLSISISSTGVLVITVRVVKK